MFKIFLNMCKQSKFANPNMALLFITMLAPTPITIHTPPKKHKNTIIGISYLNHNMIDL